MKTKGITIWERHAEKMVLGAAFVVAAFLVARQFIGNPNAISSQGGRTIAPGEVDGLLRAEALGLQGRLEETAASPRRLEIDEFAYDELVDGLEGSISPRGELALQAVDMAPTFEGFGLQGDIEFAVPRITPAYGLQVEAFADALHADEIDQNPGLEELIDTAGGSYDLKYVTVFARFDLEDLRREFEASSGDTEAIPPSWYHDRPENIVDIVVEREEKLEDGGWGNRVVLEPIPGRATFRAELAGEMSGSLRDRILMDLDNGVQTEIIQPPFYETVNEEWGLPLPPEMQASGSTAGDEAGSILRQLQLQRTKKARKQRTLRTLGVESYGDGEDTGPPDDDYEEEDEDRGNRPPGRTGGGGGRQAPGMGTDMGPGSGSVGKRGAASSTEKKKRERIRTLKRQIDDINARIAELKVELERIAGPGADSGEIDMRTGLVGENEVWIWAHDLTVDSGKTYRYAMTVQVYNPLFGKKRSLIETQQPLAEKFTLTSDRSEWSHEMRIKPFVSVFITRATPTGSGFGSLDLGRATAEVWRFSDGEWWMETFTVGPGDHIGEMREQKRPDGEGSVEIDFKTGLIVLDIIEDVGGSKTHELSRSAKVLLQDLATGEILEIRDPARDKDSLERDKLRSRLAERPRAGEA